MKKILILTLLLSILYGCSNSAPKCDSNQVIETVKEIGMREIAKGLGNDKIEELKKFKLNVHTIRTSETDTNTGTHSCKANVTLFYDKKKGKDYPIVYTVEKAEKGQFYVEVFGF